MHFEHLRRRQGAKNKIPMRVIHITRRNSLISRILNANCCSLGLELGSQESKETVQLQPKEQFAFNYPYRCALVLLHFSAQLPRYCLLLSIDSRVLTRASWNDTPPMGLLIRFLLQHGFVFQISSFFLPSALRLPLHPQSLFSFLRPVIYSFFLLHLLTRGNFFFFLSTGLSDVTKLHVDLSNFPNRQFYRGVQSSVFCL